MSQEGPLKKQKLFENGLEECDKETEDLEEKGFVSSPDMFAESPSPPPECSGDKKQPSNDVVIQIENDSEINSQSKFTTVWQGTSLEDLMDGCNLPQLPPIKPSEYHSVLYRVPIIKGVVPEAYPRFSESGAHDLWDNYHVRMPNSPQSQYKVVDENGEQRLENRWSLIKKAFSAPIKSSHELATAILSYNSKYIRKWDFNTLHYFLNEEVDDDERKVLFDNILPSIINLALLLPDLVTAPIPLLRRYRTRSISISQLQAATLLANAFLCSFPRRNAAGSKSEYAAFPDINFNRLFCSNGNAKPLQRNVEKLKCIFSYFRRVCNTYPKGVLTFTRKHIEKSCLPRWDRLESQLTALHVTSVGTIEDQGAGMLQADFANCLVGGGVLGSGCVQEEIRFVICPELIIARLFTEELDMTEALVITGCERFSCYKGYSDSFEWTGIFQDDTLRDSSGRLQCSIVAIDALYLRNPDVQFSPKCMLREVNKAFVGCCNLDVANRLSPFATGNWGCGAFRGDPHLKAVLQLMAAAAAQRSVAYFTFGDEALREALHAVHILLVEQRVTIARLWAILSAYHRTFRDGKPTSELYAFIYDAVLNDTQFNASGSQRFSPRKVNRNENTRRSRGADGGASTSRAIESDELERALEESLRTSERRRIPPKMDDATREAKLACIENSGQIADVVEHSLDEPVKNTEPKSPARDAPELQRKEKEEQMDSEDNESSPNSFEMLLLEIDAASPPAAEKEENGKPSSSTSDQQQNQDNSLDVVWNEEIESNVPTKRSVGTTQKKVTDYFLTNAKPK